MKGARVGKRGRRRGKDEQPGKKKKTGKKKKRSTYFFFGRTHKSITNCISFVLVTQKS